MTDQLNAYVGAQIFDGSEVHLDCALIVKSDVFGGIIPVADIPAGRWSQIAPEKRWHRGLSTFK